MTPISISEGIKFAISETFRMCPKIFRIFQYFGHQIIQCGTSGCACSCSHAFRWLLPGLVRSARSTNFSGLGALFPEVRPGPLAWSVPIASASSAYWIPTNYIIFFMCTRSLLPVPNDFSIEYKILLKLDLSLLSSFCC